MCILLGLIAIFSTQMAASTTDATADAIFGNLSSQVSTFVTSWVPLIFLGIGILAAVIFIAMAIMYLRGTAGGMGGA
jgi:hypothetical protein